MSDQKRVHLRIHGRVQGVFFRANTRDQANQLGLAGWVRNRPDGSVEAVAEGPEEKLRALVDWCHEGPRSADVEKVEVDWGVAEGNLKSFEVRR